MKYTFIFILISSTSTQRNMSEVLIPSFKIKTDQDSVKYIGNDEKVIYPIHRSPVVLKQQLRELTHHYCDIFTKYVLAPLSEKVYIENEEFNVNKYYRILIVSYDGKLNLWQCAPTFKSSKNYLSGTPLLDSSGNVVSIITGSKDGYYAISSFDGVGGKFETNREWITINGTSNGFIYGNRSFLSREELKEYISRRRLNNLNSKTFDFQAIVVNAPVPRIVLFDLKSGLEVSHTYVRGEFELKVCDKYH